jgi:glycosyltransferase involved in cell wall biosynthesis
VKYFPKVSLEHLAEYYKHASLFIHPSIYEGFGYPVYEANAAEIPIIVGRREMYNESIRNKLLQLSFNIRDDIKLINEALVASHTNTITDNYMVSTKRLLKIYSQV